MFIQQVDTEEGFARAAFGNLDLQTTVVNKALHASGVDISTVYESKIKIRR